MVDLFCDSFDQVARRILLDIPIEPWGDTLDRVHGGQQLSLFHAHHDSRCFLPIHIYEATTGKPVAMILRPVKTPDGAEVALVLRHLVKAIRRRWPKVEIVIRGDSHYARPEAMALRGLLAASLPEIGSKASWPSMARAPATIDTLAGTLSLDVPETAGTDGPYYPQALAQCLPYGPPLVPGGHAGGRRDGCVRCLDPRCRAGAGPIRLEEPVVDPIQPGPHSAGTPFSRAAKLLSVRGCGDSAPHSDDELEAWRGRTLGQIRYLFPDAGYEKSRQGGVGRDAAVLSAVAVGPEGRRRVLGVSVAFSEAEVPHHGKLGRAFLEDLVARGRRGVRFVTADDHAGLKAARKAVLGGAVPPRSADRVPFGSRMNGLLAIHG